MQQNNSVIIIGAGLAGLTAADQILRGNPKAEVTVLQAMSAPGGRTRSVNINGATYDLGAQWIGHTQKYVQNLAQRSKNQTMEQLYEGNKIIEFSKEMKAYNTSIPKDFGIIQYVHIRTMIRKLDKLAETVPLDCPRNCPNAIQFDSKTVHSWIEQNIWFDKVRRFFELLLRSLVGCETNEVSFLFFLWYIHQNSGLQTMINTDGGLQAHKFIKGSQPMSFYLEAEIKRRGGKIYYNSFVSKINQNEKGVSVETRTGQKFESQFLIIAAPPPAIRNIQFEPQLSRQRRFIASRYNMGAYSKLIILYDKPYWKQNGFSGEMLSDCSDGPVLNAYDDTKPKENGEMQPAIVIICGASIDQQWTGSKEECKKAALKKLASFFKCEQMLNPIAIEMKVWNDEESLGGAPTAYTPPGVLTKISNLREPEGRIHWAGTETALVSQGYMDGAIESGIRVSKEVLQRFRKEETVAKQPMPTSKWYSQISTFKRRSWLSKFLWW